MFEVMMYDGGVYKSEELFEAIEDVGGVILQTTKSAQILTVTMSIPREDKDFISKVCQSIGGEAKCVPLAGTEIAVIGCTLGRHHMPHPICDIAEEVRQYGGITAVMGLARGRGKNTSQISAQEKSIIEEYDAAVFMLGNFKNCIDAKKELFKNINTPVILVCGPPIENFEDNCEVVISGVGRKAERMKSPEEMKKLQEIGDAIDEVIKNKKTMLEEDPLFIHPAELKKLLEEYEPINMSLRPAPIVLHLDSLRVKISYREHKDYFNSLEVYGRKLKEIARVSESKIDDSSTIIHIKTLSEIEYEDKGKTQ